MMSQTRARPSRPRVTASELSPENFTSTTGTPLWPSSNPTRERRIGRFQPFRMNGFQLEITFFPSLHRCLLRGETTS